MIDGWGISSELAFRWMSLYLTDDKSTLVHVMAWCRQATSHYLSQCWPSSLPPYGITKPQWVKIHSMIWCRKGNLNEKRSVSLSRRNVNSFSCSNITTRTNSYEFPYLIEVTLSIYNYGTCKYATTQRARFTWPTLGPPGSCRPHVGPMNLAISEWRQQNLVLFAAKVTPLLAYWSHLSFYLKYIPWNMHMLRIML